jgi:uncharacterized DUF497 family protein
VGAKPVGDKLLYFDWDPQKEEQNKKIHGISFAAASTALEDPFALEEFDRIIDGEVRLRTTGMAAGEVVVVVVHTNEYLNDGMDELARIISARKASPGERRDYEQLRSQSGGNPIE